MRPERRNIAAPPFLPGTAWVGEEPVAMERLTARGPVLVHFIDFAQLNSVRALPYAVALDERYREAGLTVLGVHSPRSAPTADAAALGAALERLGVRHPVAADLDYAIWHGYGCEGWPSLFLWGRGGVLRWFHFGEGAYDETELAVQEELRSTNEADALPDPLPPLRPSDAPGAVVIAPTEEVLPGGSLGETWPADGVSEPLELDYLAGGAYASADGSGTLAVRIDDTERAVAVDGAGLYELASHDRHGSHHLRIEPPAGVRVWSVSFAPGVPDGAAQK